MKHSRKINQQQAELFSDVDPSNRPIPLKLPIQQETELERAVAELLLGVARKRQKQTGDGNDA